MSDTLSRREAIAAALSLTVLPAISSAEDKPAAPDNALVMIVSDPLSAELACPCVDGYAQRNYDKLAKYLEGKLGRPVVVHYAESLPLALTKKTKGKADLIIGKDSVTRAHAAENKLTLTHLAALTGLDGKTTQYGLVCVAAEDKAFTPVDLKGYKIYFGSAAADEKHAAAVKMFKDLGVELPQKLETCPTCTDGATKVLEEAKAGNSAATVISSYALALLEGCGTIKKGELRVIGETETVPFIGAFATGSLNKTDCDTIKAALLEVVKDKELSKVLETKAGFVEPPAKKK